MWYSVNFSKLTKLLLPAALRKPIIMAYLKALALPIAKLYDSFTFFRANEPYGNLYKLKHTGQVCYLRKLLNDIFDPGERRIIIIPDAPNGIGTYIRTHDENEPKYLGKIYLRTVLEFADTGADFYVKVPAGILAAQEVEIRQTLDFYKLASKRYIIEAL